MVVQKKNQKNHSKHNEKNDDFVKVCVHLRTSFAEKGNFKEEKDGSTTITVSEEDEENLKKKVCSFTFDKIIYGKYNGIYASTKMIFDSEIVYSVLDSVLRGYNGSIILFGSACKLGIKKHFTELIQHCFSYFAKRINQKELKEKEYSIIGSWVRLFMNRFIFDCLDNSENTWKKNLKVRARKGKNNSTDFYVDGTIPFEIKDIKDTQTSKIEIEKIIEKGKRNTWIQVTAIDTGTISSHSIFTMVIESKEKDKNGNYYIQSRKLTIIDLSGSEKRTKQIGDELKLVEFNKEFAAFKKMVSCMSDKRKFIPYRSSELTKLMKNSMENCKTVFIADCVSSTFENTMNTLKFISRIRQIQNKPTIC